MKTKKVYEAAGIGWANKIRIEARHSNFGHQEIYCAQLPSGICFRPEEWPDVKAAIEAALADFES
jgi:hypothetical protein